MTLAQRPPLLRVTCTWPSLVPAQITPFSSGDSAIANTTPAYSTPMLSGVRPPEIVQMRLVVQRQVRADLLPALPAVRRPVDVLAARVDRVVIVRRDGDRKRPVEAILHVTGRRADGDFRPYLDFAHLPRALVEALYGTAEAPEPGAGGPDDVVVDRIRNREAALTARH